jgi:hypothetical protein
MSVPATSGRMRRSSTMSAGFVRWADGSGARFEGGAVAAAVSMDRFVDEPGGVEASVSAEDLSSS